MRLARQCLFTFGSATAGLAIATILNLPGFAETKRVGSGLEGMRTSSIGYNPNDLGAVCGVAALMLIGLLLDNTRRTRARAWLLACLILPLLALMVATMSKGALVSFMLGVSLFLAPLAPARRRIMAIALGVFGVIALVAMVARDPVSVARWNQVLNEGRGAGREVIYPLALQMIRERPILGWGPIEFSYELGSRLDLPSRDPHGMFLYLLLEGGIVGTFFFLAGYWLCARAAWRSRAGPEGILPLALMVTVTAFNLTGSWFARKTFWLVLAIALTSPVARREWQRALSLRNRRAGGVR
jgi:O-antigen ligase